MRMALDLGLHRALDKLAEEGGSKKRSEEEERNLGTSFHPAFVTSHHDRSLSRVRTYLAVPLLVRPSVGTIDPYTTKAGLILVHRMSLGTGRPIVLRDESSIKHCRLLLKHPMASPTDVRLISQVELIAQKSTSDWSDG